MGVFADWAEKYWEQGLTPIPVNPETKACQIKNWSTIFIKDMDEEVLNKYIKEYGHWDIGLVCGKASGVVAADFDWVGDHHLIYERMILGVLPPTPVAKMGLKKWTRFYKNHESLKLRHIKWQDTDKNFFDLIGDGPGLTVLPPSRHSDGCKYKWISTESLLDIDIQDLPIITSKEIDAIEEIAKLDINVVHALAGQRSGRVDRLFGSFWALSDICENLDHLIDSLISVDIAVHGKHEKGPYFSDPKYRKNKTAENFARFEVDRWVQYKIKSKAKKGIVWDIGCDVDYPSKINNFYMKVPKMKNGEICLDKEGEIIMVEKPDYEGMASYMKDKLGVITSDGVSYIYNGKNHENLSDLMLKKQVNDLLGSRYNPTSTKNFSDAIRTKCFAPQSSFNQSSGFLNMKNGILDISSRELRPHSKNMFFKYCLSTSYSPSAVCRRWLEFLDFIFEGNKELIGASQEIFGYCMQGGAPWLHKAFFLYGSGRNGKSTWLDTLVSLIGEENRSAVPLSGLVKPFSVVMADGKLVNAVSEGESRDISSEAFKAACSGDTLIAAHKGKPEFAMPWTARMVISLNNLPNFRDTSVGSFERAYVLPFNRYIQPGERDPQIREKLSAELSGILNWSLDGLDRLLKRGRLPEIEAQKDAMEEYKENSDTVYEWFKEWVTASDTESKFTPGMYYNHYSSWTRSRGRFASQKNIFVKNLLGYLKKHFNITRQTVSKNKTQVQAFVNISANIGNDLTIQLGEF